MNRKLDTKKSFADYWNEVKKSAKYLAIQTSYKCPLDSDDVLSEFMVDAWKSYESYDPERGVQFNTYALHRMHNHRKTLLNKSIQDQENGKAPAPLEDEILFTAIDSSNQAFPLMEDEILELLETNRTLDLIENLLKDRQELSSQDQRAHDIFCKMRYEGKSRADCGRDFKITNTWLSQIFSKKVKAAGQEVLVADKLRNLG